MDGNKKTDFKWLVLAAIIIVLVVVGVFLLPKEKVQTKYKNLEEFAQCLTGKGVKMYGTYWCSHCKDQKNDFGKAFEYIDYVECTEETEACAEAKIEVTPTWTFASSTKLEGRRALEELATEAGCELLPN